MKVLLFSNDLMPFGQLPTSGGGLRCWQLYQGLRAHGIEVVASMPGFTYLTETHYDNIPEEQRELLWQWDTQDEILEREKPDAVLFASNWDHFNLSRRTEVPLIVDLHGSRLIETSMWGERASSEKKVEVLGKADCLLTAGQRQRSYFSGWLLQAGRVPDDDHFIRYIPISLSPEQPEHVFSDPSSKESPRIVSGGGWFPWQNQAKAIFAVCNRVEAERRGFVEIYGTPHEVQGNSAEERFIHEIYQKVKTLSESSAHIRVNGYIGRNELIEVYRHADVALEAMVYNLERELAFTTRTIEYLWCGLPVLYNNYGEISEHIEEYDAGWTVDPSSEESINRALDEIFGNPALVQQKSKNASRLVRERFSWDQTIAPLVDFLQNPTRAKSVEPVFGTVHTWPSFLSPRGATAEISLGGSTNSLSQRFIVPAEDIRMVELPFAVKPDCTLSEIRSIEMTLGKPGKRSLVRKSFKSKQLRNVNRLLLEFPFWYRPRGGTELELQLKLEPTSPGNARPLVDIRGLIDQRFPFVQKREAKFRGLTLLGEKISVASLAIGFIPGTGGGLYRLRSLFERLAFMVRNRQWRRILRAFRNRLPQVVDRMKRLVFAR